MPGTSVGEIGLDLVVNRNGFDKQMQGIQGLAKKAGLALAAAFSVKKIVDFGKACIELGSDLDEVQNVVDVTFPAMSEQVDKFAKNAAASFGLSETMAKKFTGTFGSMAKAFGFNEKAAYDMSATLTGLAGDVASFYNISQDEAYTKLKSVFTGETESLKDLGVVMTQSALDAYALANGFGKTTKAMSEAEKVSLRYAFVQEKLSAASGDFIRTSDGWANQVRVLKLQFESLKATIGQGLINVLTPVIKVINIMIGKLMTLANAFKALTEMISGKKSNGAASSMKETADAAGAAAGAADDVASATDGVGKAASKAAKKLKGLYSFDSLNVVNKSEDSGGGGGTSGGFGAADIDMGSVDTGAVDAIDSKFQKLIDRCKELAGIFKNGFSAGQGESWGKRIEDIQSNLSVLKGSLVDIFTNPEVVGGVNKFADSIAYNLGRASGSVASIGLTIGQNLVGGIAKYLSGNSDRIKKNLVRAFDVGADIADLVGSFTESFAYVFEAFGSENGQQLTANLISIFTTAFTETKILIASFARDMMNVFIRPFVDNKESLRAALEGFLGTVSNVCESIKNTIYHTFDGLFEVYDTKIKPYYDSVASGLSELAAKFLEFWNVYVQPMLDSLAQKFDELMSQHIQPMIGNAIALLGSIASALQVLWVEVLQPLIGWIIDNILPVLLPIFEGLYTGLMECVGFMSDSIGGLLNVLRGVIDFVVNIFTGNWSGAWMSIQNILKGAADQMKAAINLAMTSIRTVVDTVLNALKAKFTVVFNGILDIVKPIINSIIVGVERMANGVISAINGMIAALNSIRFTAPDWLPGIGGKSFGFNLSPIGNISIPRLANGGYVEKNTPQLAMIGDNRHQGEIVAPEDKMYEVCYRAMSDAMKQLVTALQINRTQGEPVKIAMILKADQDFIRSLKFELDKESSRTGIDFEVVPG